MTFWKKAEQVLGVEMAEGGALRGRAAGAGAPGHPPAAGDCELGEYGQRWGAPHRRACGRWAGATQGPETRGGSRVVWVRSNGSRTQERRIVMAATAWQGATWGPGDPLDTGE